MPHTKSAKKRLRQNEKRRLRNRFFRGLMRSKIKRFRAALAAKNLEEAEKLLPEVVSTIDHVASKGVIKKGQASRRVSRLSQQLHKLRLELQSEQK